MTRDELLVECFGRSDFPQPLQTIQMFNEATGDVLANVDVYLRRVKIRRPAQPGAEISEAATTLTVLALAQVCTAPTHRGKGYASALVKRAHAEVKGPGRALQFAALFGPVEFYGRVGYFHPDGSPPDFLVCKLIDEDWPAGRVSTLGEW